MPPVPENVKARQWREQLGLSYDALADLSGYSALAIRYFEKGLTPLRTRKHMAGHAIKPAERQIKWYVFLRYKNVCAGVQAQLKSGSKFEWE